MLIENIRKLIEDDERVNSLSDLEKKTGLSNGTIKRWVASTPKADSLLKVAKYFGVSMEYLMGLDYDTYIQKDPSFLSYVASGKARKVIEDSEPLQVNVYGDVAAGIPIEEIRDIIDVEELPAQMKRDGYTYYGLRVKGDSMEPRICEGDTVIVRQQESADTGDTVIAQVDGNCACVKHLRKNYSGIELLSNNPKYKPMVSSNKEVRDTPVRILGKVIEVRIKGDF